MKHAYRAAIFIAFGALASACQERLTTPADCPNLCPGSSLVIRDTVIEAEEERDSSFTGYIGANAIPALLVSNGLEAGEARIWTVFPRHSDSVLVDGLQKLLNIDSLVLSIRVIGIDSQLSGTALQVFRINPAIDTTTSFAELESQLTPEALLGSIPVKDTGTVTLNIHGDDLARITPQEADSFRTGLGFKVSSTEPTGVRISSLSGTGPPQLTLYGKVDVSDTAKQKQTLTAVADSANYVILTPAPPGPDVLFIGGRSGSRAILRFRVPPALKDSVIILRATLELTPAGPLLGLKNDPAALEIRGVQADVGAKSPYLSGLGASTPIPIGGTDLVSVDIRDIVGTWFVVNAPPSTLFIGLTPEGGTFALPEFFSTRSAGGKPRLRITYALPARPGHP